MVLVVGEGEVEVCGLTEDVECRRTRMGEEVYDCLLVNENPKWKGRKGRRN